MSLFDSVVDVDIWEGFGFCWNFYVWLRFFGYELRLCGSVFECVCACFFATVTFEAASDFVDGLSLGLAFFVFTCAFLCCWQNNN